MKTKVCSKCGIEKPMAEFENNRGRKRRQCKPCRLKYQRTLKKKSINHELYRKLHPEIQKCRLATRRAIKGGLLVRGPCEICNKPNTEAHHDDYSKPLEVGWLCPYHHRDLHMGYKQPTPLRLFHGNTKCVRRPWVSPCMGVSCQYSIILSLSESWNSILWGEDGGFNFRFAGPYRNMGYFDYGHISCYKTIR